MDLIGPLPTIPSGHKYVLTKAECAQGCFEKQALERFPLSTANEVDRAGLAHCVIHLFCTCNMPATYGTKMIACDICEKWFHFKCVGLRKRARLATWVCRKCI